MAAIVDDARRAAVAKYRDSLLKCRELDSQVNTARENLKQAKKDLKKSEEHVKAFQSTGQVVAEVMRPLDNDRFIVKASTGPRYLTTCRSKLNREDLVTGTRVCLDNTTLTIMRILPREVDPLVFNMVHEDPGNVSFSAIGGLNDQIREVREIIELPIMNPELFPRVGIKPPKGVLLYGPPGTGKTLLARALASNIDANFMKVVSSAIIDKYIGESSRIIREMFAYARDHEPCIIFMDEIDAIGGRRFSEGTSADREIQRTLMELLNQMDGFDELGKVKIIMATNRPDVLDPALLRPGRLDRKIEIPLPNEQSRVEILKIHAAGMAKHGEIDYEAAAKLAEGFNAADMRNVCTEAGMELLNQMDGFDELGKVKIIMATNRPDVLDPALLRPGRLDRKIEIPLPNEQSRVEILKIHAAGMAKHGEIDYEAAAKLAEGFNAADMRNVCTEAGMAAIRAERDYAVNEDFMKGVRKLMDAKKLESSADYKADFGKD